MSIRTYSTWLYRLFITLITAALCLAALPSSSQAMSSVAENKPRLPDRTAATITVQSAADDGTANPGNCPGAGCRLRDALAYASSGDTINFGGNMTITLTSQLVITQNLTLDGETHVVTVSGNHAVRVFVVNAGITFNLYNLTVTNGYCSNCYGGGVYNQGNVSLHSVTLSNNIAQGFAGGIYNSTGSSLNIVSSILSGNQAIGANGADGSATGGGGGGGGAAGLGGAIFNESTGAVSVISSTLSSNQAIGGDGGDGFANGGVSSGTGGSGGGQSGGVGGTSGNPGSAGGLAGGGGGGGGSGSVGGLGGTGGLGGGGGGSGAKTGGGSGNGGGPGGLGGGRGSDGLWSGAGGGGGGAGLGGAIFSNGGALTLTNSVVMSNIVRGGLGASGYAGAWGENGRGLGGGVFIYSNTVANLASAAFRNNAASDGGGVYVATNGPVNLSGATFSGNAVTSNGGGVFVYSNTIADLANATFNGNSAVDGGGLSIATGGVATLSSTTLRGNTATDSGGGLYVNGRATISNSTIVTNTAVGANGITGTTGLTGTVGSTVYGGGIAVISGTLMLESTTVMSNTATGGNGGAGGAGASGSNGSAGTDRSNETGTTGGDGGAGGDGSTGGAGAQGGDALGGGLYIANTGVVTITTSNVTSNTASAGNGGQGGLGGASGAGGNGGTGGHGYCSSMFSCSNAGNGGKGGSGAKGGTGGSGGTGGQALGGGVYNLGRMVVLTGTLMANQALGGSGGVGGYGNNGSNGGQGGNGGYGTTFFPNCSRSGDGGQGGNGGNAGNGGTGGSGGPGQGGAIFSANTLDLSQAQISNNTNIQGGIGRAGGNAGSVGTKGNGGNAGPWGTGCTYGGGAGAAGQSNGSAGLNGGTGAAGHGNGGGLYIYGITNIGNQSIISGNQVSGNGGGLYIFGTTNINQSVISGNQANGNGGGLYNANNLIVRNSTLSSNSANSGGGLYNAAGTADFREDSVISGNQASGNGGGLYNANNLIVLNSTLSSNSANSGGGLYNADWTQLDSSTLSGNSASNGGGLFNTGTLWLGYSTLSGNSATSDGGGVHNANNLAVENSTFNANTATSHGGGINNDSLGQLTMKNSTLSANSAALGGGLRNWGKVVMSNTIIANSPSGGDCTHDYEVDTSDFTDHNLIESTGYSACRLTNGTGGSLVGVDPMLRPLGNYGGSTLTFAPLPGSPIIDAGNASTCLEWDQRDVDRPQGDACDIGAVEWRGYALTKSGDNQSAVINTTFAQPLSVTLGEAGGVGWPGMVITFTAPNSGASIASPTTVTATTNANGQTWIEVAANGQGGSYTVTASAAQVGPVTFALTNTYLITPTTGANGSITPSTPQMVNHGSAITFTITPNTGYHIVNVGVDGVSQGPIGSYTFNNIVAHHTISAAFAINTYTITPTTSAHGTITPDTAQTVNYGASLTFTITPDSGYNIAGVWVDGVSQGAIGSYTFSTIAANHTISASFGANLFIITPSAGAGGSLTPGAPQAVSTGSAITFTITPDTGYHLVDVAVDGVSQGLIGSYIFTNVITNHTISASFAINTYTITPTAGANGSLTPDTPQTVNYGDVLTLTITPDTGYHIVDVVVDGSSQGPIGSYTFNGIAANHTISASFAINTYTITPTAGANGSITPGAPQTVNYGGTSPFTITPNLNYHIANVLVDGVSQGPISSYTFTNVTAHHTISASFAINTYTITPLSGTDGSITPDAPQTVNYGDVLTFTITPNTGYHIVDVGVDGLSQGPIGWYTFNAIAANHTLSASFAINTYTITPTAGANGAITPGTPQTLNYGSAITFTITPSTGYHIVDVGIDGTSQGAIGTYMFSNVTANHTITAAFAINTFTITPTAGANGSITPGTPQTVNHGEAITFTITPDTGYHIVDVGVDGVSQGAIGTYMFSNVTANHTISASFAINTFTITPTAGANGSITPSTLQTVNYGASLTFTITPNTNYHIASVLVDGASQGVIGSYTFSNVTANHTISASFAIDTHIITPTAGVNGSITPGTAQAVNYGSAITFTITPDTGYHIVDVGVDGSSQGAIESYTFSNVTAQHTLTASFAINTFTITPTAGANGSITPGTPQTVNHGEAITFTITPDVGYHVVDVGVDGSSQGPIGSYTFGNVTASHTITAAFAINTYTITPTAGANGSISPGTAQGVNYGANITFTITPNTGYHIVDVGVDGASQGAIGTYTFSNMTASHTLSASFAINTYTITPTAGANGSITPGTPQTVNYGDAITFTIAANANYHLVDVAVDGVSQGAIGAYAFSNVMANHTISAAFAINTYTITPTAGANGSITPGTAQTVNYGSAITFTITPNTGYHIVDVGVDGLSQGAIGTYMFSNVTANHTITAAFAINTYTITPTAGVNGAITPGTPQTVNYSDAITFTIAPNTGYHIVDVGVDGVSQGALGSYTFSNVTANHTISVSFAINIFTITPTAGANGSIMPGTAQTVSYGSSLTFTITPNTNYHIASVLVDGASQGVIGSYTFSNVTANHTISASFAIDTHIITPTAGVNGSITPGTAQTVNYGSAITFTIAPNTGYHIVDVGVDGSSQGAIGSYTFSNVTANHTISAAFAINTYTITPTAGVNGSITPGTLQTVNYGASLAFTITPNSGYSIAAVWVDGVSQGAIGTYTFSNIAANHTLTAAFGSNLFTVTPSAGPGGSITPGTPQAVTTGSSITFTIAADAGYAIDDVAVDGMSQGAIGAYTFSNVTANHVISAAFFSTGPQTRTVGVISVMADTFTDLGNGQTQATGNIRLGHYLFLTDPADSVVYDTTNLTATGKVTVMASGSTLNVVTGTFRAPITTGVAVPIGTPDDLITSAAGFVLTNVVVSDINIPIDQFSVNANLNVAVKDITITTGVDLYVSGASSGLIYSGTLGAFDFAVGGVTVTVAPSMTLSNTGIAIPSAVITLPVSLGGASSTIHNLTITSSGLTLEDGSITLPDIKWGDGSKIKLIQPIAHLSVLTDTYQFKANGTLSLTLPSNNLTTTLGFTLTQGGQMTGTLSNLNLTVAGAMLTMTNIAVSNSGLGVDAAKLQLPASLGDATTTLNNVSIGAAGLTLGNGTFSLPVIKIGDGQKISITQSLAQLSIGNNQYQFAVTGTLNLNLPSNAITTTLGFAMQNGQMTGTLSALNLQIAGATLGMTNALISNAGFAVTTATMQLPSSLGSGMANLSNVGVYSNGLNLGNGTFTLPTIKIGDGSRISLTNSLAQLAIANNEYDLDVTSTLNLNLPGNQLHPDLGFNLHAGQMTGTLSALNLQIAGATLGMTNALISNAGFAVTTTTLQLPSSLGSGTANLSNVGVYSNGLNLGSGTFALPAIKIGDGSRISLTNSLAQLAIANNEYDLDVTSTLNLNLPGNQLHPDLGFNLHAGQMTGTLSALNLQIAGATLGMTNALISNAGFAVTTATLQLPSSLGSGTANLSNVGVYSNGLNLGNGTFSLPVIKIGDGSRISLTNSLAQLAIANNEYDLDVTSTLNLNLPGNQLHPDLGFNLHAGQMTGTLSALNLQIAGATLGMTNALISNTGFAVTTATLQLPSSLGSGTANLSNVGVYSNGLNLGSGTFALPVIRIGDGSRISLTNSLAQLAIANNEYDLDVTSTLNLNLPGNQLHPDLGFNLHAGQMTGTLSALNLQIAGATLGMTNALISNAGFAVTTATLQLPSSLGSGTANLSNVGVYSNGLNLGSGTFVLPVIKIGDGSRISLTNSLAQLAIANNEYDLDVSSTLNLNLPGNQLHPDLGFNLHAGQMTGTLSALNLQIAGATLGMTNALISNAGFAVTTATLQLPSSLGSGTANLSNVGVYSNGLNLGSGTFVLPVIKIGDGSRISLTNSLAQLAIANNEYDLDVTSTLNLNLPGNQLHPDLGFNLHAGQMTGTLSALNLQIAGATLGMTNALISNAGFAVTTATLQLPSSLGSGTANLSNVGVYSNGLNLGSGTFALPVIKIGDGSRISLTNSLAQLAIANNEYDLDVTSTLNLNLPGNQLHPDLGFNLHAGQMTGTLSALNLQIAGATLGMTNALISNAGFAVTTATLQLPTSLGSGTANLSNVGVYSNGLNLGSGTFALPVIKIGDGSRISLTNSLAQLAIANHEYDLDVTSTLNLNLPSNALTSTLGFALHAGQMTGTLSNLNLQIAGATLGMTNALISNAGFAVTTATLQLPSSLGSGTANLSNVGVYSNGLNLGSGTFALPVIKIGDGKKISITQSLAQLSIGDGEYQFAVSGTLNLNLPSNALTTTLGFAMVNGQMTGTLSSLHLTMAGSTLAMTNVVVSNAGLSVNSAVLQLPASLGSTAAAIGGLTIDQSGLTLEQGTLALPDIKWGDGSKVKIAQPSAQLTVLNNQYQFSAHGTLSLTLPNNNISSTLGFTVTNGGQLTGTVNVLNLSLAGGTLTMTNIAVTNSGLSVAVAQLKLPASLGGGLATVNDVTIDANGLSVSAGTFSVADINVGDGSKVKIDNPTATLSNTVAGYTFGINGTLQLRLPDNSQDIVISGTVNTSGQFTATISSISLTLAKATLQLNRISMDNTGLSVVSGTLALPAKLGSVSGQVANVRIDANGLSIGGGAVNFPIPDFKIGGTSGFGVSNALASLNLVNNAGAMSYQMALSGTIAITLPGTSASAQGLVQVDNAGNIGGRVNAFTLAVAGMNLSVNNISLNADGSFAIASATLALPGGFGGGSASVSNVVVYPGQPGSLSLGSAGISLPDIKWGDGSKVKIINANAQLTQVNNKYSFAFGGKLSLNLPGNVVTSTLAFAIRDDGQISGTVDLIKLTVAGGTLTMTNVSVLNSGLTVGAASLKMPASLGSAVVTINGVSVDANGLHLGGGQLTLADINIGDGSKVKIAAPTATLGEIPGGYTFGINGTLQLRLPSNSQNIGIAGTINSSGQFTASVSAMALTFGGATLNLSNVTLNNSGLSVVSGTLQLPAKLGGASGGVNNVVINANGLSIGGGALTFPIPDFKIGGASGFSVSNAQAGLQLTNGGLSYRLNLSGTVAIKIPGSNATASGRVNMDDAGNMSGQVDAFTLTIAGMGLNVSNIAINPDGSFTAGAAGFTTPSGFGGASASVYNVVIRPGNPGSVSIGGGIFTLPTIKAGGFGLALSGALKPITSGYEISATGFATFPGVGGAAGCEGVGVGATIWTDAQGQTQLALRPDETNGVALKNASFNLQCQIAIGTTGFFITGIEGAVTLGPTSTQVDVGIQIAAGKKIAGFTALSADATATLKTNPFDLLLNGAVRVFVFQVGGATAHMTDHSFSATLWVNMIVAKGDIAFNAWSDAGNFHMNGSGNMQVGLAKGAIFNGTSLPYPCCECGWREGWLGVPYYWCGNCQICWTESLTIPSADYLFNANTAFGEFTGDHWGLKGTVSVLGYNAGFFVDTQGNLTVGNVDSYQLITPTQVSTAIAQWQAARLTGLAPNATAEFNGIRFVGDTVMVPQPITATTDVIFALQRSQSVPTLTLMTPLGAEITPNNLPAGVQFAEVLTYTRNVSTTTTTNTPMCASSETVQKANQTALVRFTHARSDLGAIDVLIDGVKVFANVSFGTESNERVIDAGSHIIELVPANQPGPIVASTPITLTGNTVHRLIAAGNVTQTATLDVAQDIAPASGQATIRFAHALADAANVDVVLAGDGRVLFGDVAPQSVTAGVNLDASKPYTFEVYAAGTNQLLAQLPNLTLTGRGTYSFIALGRVTGTPSAQLMLKADTLPLSHLRLVNAIAADQPIELWTQGITLFANLPFSATTAYNGFAGTSIDFQLTAADLNHTVLTNGSIALQSEADHTLVALDYVTQTQALLLIDDNRLPAWSKARVRFVNASPNVGAVDVLVQGAAQFNNVTFKNVGSYVELNGGTVTLEVRDHNTQSVLLTVPNVKLIDGYVYTWFLMGIRGGSPALQLVPLVDLATQPDVQTQYIVHQAQTGTWELKLNGNFTTTDQYMLTALGSNPAPVLSDLSAAISGTTSLMLNWRLNSDELGTPIGIYANSGADSSYTGRALVTNLTSANPNWINGTPQTYNVDLNQLPSGTYHVWFEANDGRNPPVRQYAPQTIVVDHVATWPLTWTAVMTVTPGFRELGVQWQPHPSADADGYLLKVSAPTLTTTQVISIGNLTSARVTALDPDRPYSLTLQAIDNKTGHVSTARTVIGIPANAAITLNGATGPINLIAGQSTNTALLVTTSHEPYPGVVSFQTGCVRLSGAACTSSVNGLNALFAASFITPTLAGVSESIVLSATEALPAGNYVVPIIATGSGLSRTFEITVAVNVPAFTLDVSSHTVSLGIAQALNLTVSSAALNGATRPIGLSVKNAPLGLLWSLDRSSITPGNSATLTITDTDLLASGVYPIAIGGDDGLLTAATTITLTVSKPRFSLTATPSNLTVAAGKPMTSVFKLDVLALDGWTTPITLTVDPSAVPALGTLGLRDNVATGAISSTLVVTPGRAAYLVAVTTAQTPQFLYTLNVDAQGGGRRQTLEVTLGVTLAARESKVYLPLVIRGKTQAAVTTLAHHQ